MGASKQTQDCRPGDDSRKNMLRRGLLILETVAEHSGRRGASVSEISAATRIERSTTSRLLAALRDADYLRQDVHRRYRLSAKLSTVASYYSQDNDLLETSRNYMEELHKRWGEEVHLAVRDKYDMVFIDYIGSTHLLRSNLAMTPRAIHLSAAGRAILAFLEAEELHNVLGELENHPLEPLTGAELPKLKDDIVTARRLGWAGYSANDGVIRFAAPIFVPTGTPRASICLSGPEFRLAEDSDELGEAVLTAARAISSELQGGMNASGESVRGHSVETGHP